MRPRLLARRPRALAVFVVALAAAPAVAEGGESLLALAPQGRPAGEAEAILAGAPEGAPPGAVPFSEPGRPRRVAASVFPLPGRPGEKTYLRMEADYEILVASPLEAVRAALLSYEAYPRYFTRLERVERVGAAGASPGSAAPGSARLKMRSVIRVLGLAFPSDCEYDYAEVLEREGAAASIGFRSVRDDGSVTDASGGWRLEARGPGRTYVRYRLSSSVRADFPMQREIMERFMDADFFAVLSGLEAEAARRASGAQAAQARPAPSGPPPAAGGAVRPGG